MGSLLACPLAAGRDLEVYGFSERSLMDAK
jgi:hypothetical protein